MKRVLTLLLSLVMLVACGQDAEVPVSLEKNEIDLGHDYFSFANTDQFVTDHLQLDLTVDFELKELRGTATLEMQCLCVIFCQTTM